MKILKCILLFIITSSLCSCKDEYCDFTNEEMNFVKLDEEEKFDILNTKTSDTLSFKITKREDSYIYGGDNLINDVYMQSINLYFESNTGESGHLFYYKENSLTLCDINFSDNNSSVIYACFSVETNNIIDQLHIKEILYENVYYFIENGEEINDTLFYTPDKGIIKFTDSANGNEYVQIEK
ncbi:MAG: hypothetical protein PF436_08355 [Prolixibacteraceae bacterium]|jgi:hypothetical protein|nr:hypothetical protein [Prolixibacteraceae bacterium]